MTLAKVKNNAKKANIRKSQKEFIKALKKKFSEDPGERSTAMVVQASAPNRGTGHHITLLPYAYAGRE